MPTYIKDRLPLFIILLIFVALKIPQLHYAFYWDECWPYAPALKAMYIHGPSLMPNAIDAELSRGHPLLFHALAAIWMNIFGTSHVSLHSFALLISVLFLIAIYETALRIFGCRVAVLALTLIIVQEMFFIQSSILLPEMLVALWCFLSLVFYAKEKYLLTALCLTLLFYTKESGLVMGAVLGIDAIAGSFKKGTSLKLLLYRLLSVGIPCVLIAVFFLIQKHLLGWYIFPMHNGMIQHKWNIVWFNFRMCGIETLYCAQMRNYYFLLLAAVAVITAIKRKKLKLLTILLPVVCIYYFVDDTRAGRLLPSVPFFIVFILSALCFIYTYSASEYCTSPQQRKLIRLSGWFILCFLCFSAMNFFTPRYILAAMIPMLFITSVFYLQVIKLSFTWLYYPVILLVLGIGVRAYMHNEVYGDCEHGIFDALTVQQGVTDYFEKNVARDQQIGAMFMESQHLTDPATGFLHSEKAFKNVKWEVGSNTHYAVFDDIEPDEKRYLQIKGDTGFYLAKRIEKGIVWAEIYKRK